MTKEVESIVWQLEITLTALKNNSDHIMAYYDCEKDRINDKEFFDDIKSHKDRIIDLSIELYNKLKGRITARYSMLNCAVGSLLSKEGPTDIQATKTAILSCWVDAFINGTIVWEKIL